MTVRQGKETFPCRSYQDYNWCNFIGEKLF
jgi:hypothetical protein